MRTTDKTARSRSQMAGSAGAGARLFAEERKRRILSLLASGESVRVLELCALLDASQASIRRDLRELEEAGLLKRTHGGAVNNQMAAFEPSLAEKQDCLRAEKRAIAALARELIHEGDTVMLDSGSTTLEIARLLRQARGITVLTNGLNIALELLPAGLEVTLTGGTLRQTTQSLVGPITENVLAGLHVDKLFLATNGLDLKLGLTTPNVSEAQSKRAMIESAREVIVVADHSKFGRVAFCQICPFSKVNCLITDAAAPAEFLRLLAESGVKVMQAGENR